MRDLHSVRGGSETVELQLDLTDDPPTADTSQIDTQYRQVRREQKVASLTVMLLDAAKLLEPVVDLLSDRGLRWAALIAAVGLDAYALKTASLTWERLALVGVFGLMAPLIIRKGR